MLVVNHLDAFHSVLLLQVGLWRKQNMSLVLLAGSRLQASVSDVGEYSLHFMSPLEGSTGQAWGSSACAEPRGGGRSSALSLLKRQDHPEVMKTGLPPYCTLHSFLVIQHSIFEKPLLSHLKSSR
jgi:hypothetical protein